MNRNNVSVTETVNNRDLSGWFMLSNGHKVGWIASGGDGELSAFVEKPDGGFINELSGWYRTSKPTDLLQKVITIAGWELEEGDEMLPSMRVMIELLNKRVKFHKDQFENGTEHAKVYHLNAERECHHLLDRITAHKMGIRTMG